MNKLFKNNSEVNKSSPVKLISHHLLAIEGMQKSEIQKLLDRADYFANLEKHDVSILNFIENVKGKENLNIESETPRDSFDN